MKAPFAFAISSGLPVEEFETPIAVAGAVLAHMSPGQNFVLHRGQCCARDRRTGEPAIAVYGMGRSAHCLGFVIGLGHDRDALAHALLEAHRLQLELLRTARRPGETLQ